MPLMSCRARRDASPSRRAAHRRMAARGLRFQQSFGCRRFLEEFDLAARVVGERKDLVELDLRRHAVALHDAVEPWPAVERFGVLNALPLVHATRPAAFAPDKVLADQPLHLAEAGRDL